jgi:hypothetical protein
MSLTVCAARLTDEDPTVHMQTKQETATKNINKVVYMQIKILVGCQIMLPFTKNEERHSYQ